MQRAAWLVALVIVTVALTVQIVRAQIVFPDGSLQETAFTGDTAVPPGAAYSRTAFFNNSAASGPITPDIVPNGQQLVILKIVGWNTTLCTLESRLPSPNQNTGPIILSTILRGEASTNSLFDMDFPDGAVVVGQGRQPYLAFRTTTFTISTAPNAQVITIIGYLRPAT